MATKVLARLKKGGFSFVAKGANLSDNTHRSYSVLQTFLEQTTSEYQTCPLIRPSVGPHQAAPLHSLTHVQTPSCLPFLKTKSAHLSGAKPKVHRSTLASDSDGVQVTYHDGLPVLSVPLPSRREACQFTLRPISSTVGQFLEALQAEDGGIDRVGAYTEDGVRIAKATPIQCLLNRDFKLVINDSTYHVQGTASELLAKETSSQLEDVKHLIAHLYSSLNVEHHQLMQEKKILERLEDLKSQVAPMEELKANISTMADKRTKKLTWVGLGLMGVQFGILARLTWWEYSWDIMEPVTYFVTYGTTMAMYAYYVLTKQEYEFSGASNRHYLFGFYKKADKDLFDVERYNKKRMEIQQVESDLRRLRDPLQLHLPVPPPQH